MVATAASAAPDETPIRPGIGQRIAEHALHHGAGDGERGADERAEQQARQADVDQHELLAGGRGVAVAGERGAAITRGRAESVMPVEPIESDRKAASARASAATAISWPALPMSRRVVSRTSHRHGRRHRVAPASPPARSG